MRIHQVYNCIVKIMVDALKIIHCGWEHINDLIEKVKPRLKMYINLKYNEINYIMILILYST